LVSTFSNDISDLNFGHVTNMELVDIDGKEHMRVWNDNVDYPNLVITHWKEDAVDDLREVINEATSSLYRALSSPYVVPGGGCVEGCILRDLIVEV